MTRETIAAALLAPLAPFLASLLVVLAALPVAEALRLRPAPSVRDARDVRGIFRPQASLGLVPNAGPSWAAGSTRRASSSARRQQASPFRSSPPAG